MEGWHGPRGQGPSTPATMLMERLGKRQRAAAGLAGDDEEQAAARVLSACASWPLQKMHGGPVMGPDGRYLAPWQHPLHAPSPLQAMPPQQTPFLGIDASQAGRHMNVASAYTSMVHGGQAARAAAPQFPWESADGQSPSFMSFSMGSRGNGGHESDDGSSWEDGGTDSKEASLEPNLAYLREKESSGQKLTAEEKLLLTRERNRDHSRKSRLRKKMYVESLKGQISDLGAYRLLVELCGDLISVHAADDKMTVIFASAGFVRVLGFEPEKLLGQNFVMLIHPEDVSRVRVAMQNALVYGDVAAVRFRIMGKDGRWRQADTSFRLHQLRQIIAISRVTGGDHDAAASSSPAPVPAGAGAPAPTSPPPSSSKGTGGSAKGITGYGSHHATSNTQTSGCDSTTTTTTTSSSSNSNSTRSTYI